MPMQLTLSAIKPPLTQITPSAINVTINSSVDVQVLLQNKTIQEAFVLGLVRPNACTDIAKSHSFFRLCTPLLMWECMSVVAINS